jgi:hypothetical protein
VEGRKEIAIFTKVEFNGAEDILWVSEVESAGTTSSCCFRVRKSPVERVGG